MTSVEDTARMVARVALDRAVQSGKFAFAGDRISYHAAAGVSEAGTGRRLARRSRGSEAGLRAAKAAAERDAADPYAPVMLAYQLYMLTGQTALTDLQNARFPDVRLEPFADFAARTMLPAAGPLRPSVHCGSDTDARGSLRNHAPIPAQVCPGVLERRPDAPHTTHSICRRSPRPDAHTTVCSRPGRQCSDASRPQCGGHVPGTPPSGAPPRPRPR